LLQFEVQGHVLTNLTDTKLAIIGAGNMGQAILAGALQAGLATANVVVTTADPQAAAEIPPKYHVTVAASNPAAVRGAQVVIIAVKPGQVAQVLQEITPVLDSDTVVVSVAVGLDLAHLSGELPAGQPVVRAMPNTPAAVGAGITAISSNAAVTANQLQLVEAILRGTGRVVIVPESYQGAVGAISGSGPAYVAYLIDALAEAGVHQGLPRALATELALATAVGTAQMLLETGEHPALARERVTSPGGTTAAALAELDNAGVRAAVLRAVAAAIKRTNEIAKS